MEPGMDFHKAFQAIDTDHSGEISVEELEAYCKKMNYKDTFVKKWLNLFDEDESGTITYDEFCNTLGLVPKQEVVEKHKVYQAQQAAGGSGSGSGVSTKKETKTKTNTKTSTKTSTKIGRSRNQALSGTVVMKLSRARMFQRKAIYRMKKLSSRSSGSGKSTSSASASKVQLTEKVIGGDKNGGKRLVPNRRSPRSLPTSVPHRYSPPRPTKCFKDHKRRLRASITPGTVLILLAGRHRGKRVVFLRQLASGLLLVTGPLKFNGCPLRRVAQSFVIATKTRIDVSGVNLPDRVNDAYFRRAKQLTSKGSKTNSADPFAKPQSAYQLVEERREDQKAVDSQVMAAIRASPDGKMLAGYMRSLFSLKNGQKPHEMVF